MNPLIKAALLATIKWQFSSVTGDDFVDLLPLGTNPVMTHLPRASKTGTYSFKITGRKLDYKLYGCINQAWADEVYKITNILRSQQVAMPRILAKKGRYILAEWIEGNDIRDTLTPEWDAKHEAVVQYQASIHNAQNANANKASISYIHDFLMSRFKKYASSWLAKDQIERIDRYVEKNLKYMEPRSPRVSHPDFTQFNLVRSGNGLVIIDNETLHYDALWEYDVLNTANILFEPLGLKEKYLDTYSRYVDISSLYRYSDFWEVIWLIRMSGGKFQLLNTEEGGTYLINLVRKTSGSIEKMPDIIGQYYIGQLAATYEKRRSQNPKWKFEDDIMSAVLNQLRAEIQSIIDAPVGTGRFLKKYAELGNDIHVTGFDYSIDMLDLAASRQGGAKVDLIRQDIINYSIPMTADLVVCYRFLNLIHFEEVIKVLGHLFTATRKYSLLAIRTIDDEYLGETYIEDKIYLHRRSNIDRVIVDNDFIVDQRYEFKDQRAGQYSILLCRRVNSRSL